MAVSIFELYAQDPNKIADGTWVNLKGEIAFKIRGIQSSEYVKSFVEISNEYKEKFGKELTEKQSAEVVALTVARGLVVGWKGIYEQDEKGELVEVPYSKENAEKLFAFEQMQDLALEVLQQAEKKENFKADLNKQNLSILKKT